jgi:hypothetical protein
MNTDQIVGAILWLTIIEIPLIISSWLLIKSMQVKINRIRMISYDKNERKKDIITIITFSIIIAILFILIIIPIIIAMAPELLLTIPVSLRLLLAVSILILYVPIYACFLALFRGLGDVVGAGGSAYNVINQLQTYIYEALEIKQEKKNNHTKI